MNNSPIKNVFSTPNLVALITGLLLFSLAPQQPIHERFSMLERVAPALVLLLITLYARRQEVRNWIIPIPLVLLLTIMAISIAQMPQFFIVKDFFAFSLLTLFAIVAVSALGATPVIWGAAISSVLLVMTSLIYAALLPGFAFEEYGQLKGAFYGSNSLALSLVLLSPSLIVFTLKSTRFTYLLRAVSLLAVFAIIYFSTSRTALVLFIVMLLAWGLFLLVRKNWKAGLVASSAGALILLLVAIYWLPITSALGKSADLSGRFPLWGVYLEAIFLKPLEGYGWHMRTTADMPLGDFIVQSTGIPQINANNDLLNWWALTGIFGVILTLIALIYVISNGLRARNLSATSSWVFLSGSVLLVAGFTELSTMHPDGWLLFSLAFVASSQALLRPETPFIEILHTGSLSLK